MYIYSLFFGHPHILYVTIHLAKTYGTHENPLQNQHREFSLSAFQKGGSIYAKAHQRSIGIRTGMLRYT